MTLDESGFPDVSEMVDPQVNVHLTNGHTIRLQQVSIVEIAKRLHNWGFAFMADGTGDYCVLFHHGVAAMTVHNSATSD